jgi:hypothetical protein
MAGEKAKKRDWKQEGYSSRMHSLTLGSTIDETCTHTHLLACFESLLPFPVFSWAFPFGAACTNFHTRQFHHVSCVLRTCMHVFVGSLSKEKKNRGGSVRISRYVLGTTRRTQRICGDAYGAFFRCIPRVKEEVKSLYLPPQVHEEEGPFSLRW